ncbi:ABC transporter permease [Jidongwangia harbinensis]|uniref:ABC transporter permease n=1 Tax=Jidongwangia harbinensis TaxID=2878561 RepID=UPI001CD95EBC|nr:FtsX-like permease family protein [Jidongwangia harbinensis]MCA2218756.1 FtsX-like permease family protein [Jidongwangia harbinensis]
MLHATWKSLLSRKLRLLLSGLAIVLGVTFVSGAFVLTDTLGRAFDDLYALQYRSVDVQVRPAPEGGSTEDDEEIRTGVPAGLVDRVRAVPGVAAATGIVSVDGARVIGTDGKVVTTTGSSRLGSTWTGENDLVRLRAGRAPRTGDEVVLNAALLEAAGVRLGDRVGILTVQPRRTFTVVGVQEYTGGRDSLGGNLEVSFHSSVASRLMLGRDGQFSAVGVTPAAGVPTAAVQAGIRSALGAGYRVQTGAELRAAARTDAQSDLAVVNSVLLGFAAVSLLVGVVLILNTFAILVAQRTRELALLRALGGSRRQTLASVLAEALVIGVTAAAVGLGTGIGVGALLAWLFSTQGGRTVALAGIGVPLMAPVAAFGVGVLVSLVAAVVPALRAARIPVIAAMRESATPDRPLTTLNRAGIAAGTLGAALLTAGVVGDGTAWLLGAGAVTGFVGVVLLTPAMARPVAGSIGRLFAGTAAGRLGRLNAGRNPRRTANTATALMVGIALITGMNTVLASTTASLRDRIADQITADLLIAGDASLADDPPAFDPAVLQRVRALGGVSAAAGTYRGDAAVDGERAAVAVVTDVPAHARMYSMRAVAGALTDLGPNRVAVRDDTARRLSLRPGSTVRVRLAYGGTRSMTVAAVYTGGDAVGEWLLPISEVPNLAVPQLANVDLTVAGDAAVADVRRQVEALLADSPEITVTDREGYLRRQTGQYDLIATLIQILLGLAVLIAVLGVVNTLALSVLERTRELGLVRAVGLTRGQTMWMVTVEAVLIAVFGALLGVAVGTGLGAAVVRALHRSGITTFALPWPRIGLCLALGAVIGVVAAILPAARAARTDVLRAISYE